MTPGFTDLLVLFGHVAAMSLLAFGGALTVVPDLRRVMVSDMALLNEAQFSSSIAIAQASPGPNMLFIAVMGYQAAGLAGASLMLLAFLLPSTTLAYAGMRWGHSHGEHRLMRAFKTAMAPIVVALVLAGGWILAVEAPGWGALLVAVPAALIAWRTNLHLLVVIAAGATAGALGWWV